MKSRLALTILGAALMAMPLGCRTDGGEDALDAKYTRYEFGSIGARLDELRSGMSKQEVRQVLGPPAVQRGDHWLYLPNRPGIRAAQKGLRLRFNEQGSYVGRETFDIVVIPD